MPLTGGGSEPCRNFVFSDATNWGGSGGARGLGLQGPPLGREDFLPTLDAPTFHEGEAMPVG